MENSNGTNNKKNTETLQIWCCDKCRDVHFKAGNVLLNFTKEGFAQLTYNVNRVFQEQFGSLEFYDLLDLVSKNENSLLSDSVS